VPSGEFAGGHVLRQGAHLQEALRLTRRLIVEVVVAAPKLPPSAALLLSSLLPTRGTGHLPERTTRTGALRDWMGVAQECILYPNHLDFASLGEFSDGHVLRQGAHLQEALPEGVRRVRRPLHQVSRVRSHPGGGLGGGGAAQHLVSAP